MFLLKLGSELQNLIQKIPLRSENINKIQTAFPRSGTHRGGGGEGGRVHLLLNQSFFKVTNILRGTIMYVVSL